jgi:hypothetical protein
MGDHRLKLIVHQNGFDVPRALAPTPTTSRHFRANSRYSPASAISPIPARSRRNTRNNAFVPRFPTRSGKILVARALTTARNGGMADTLDAAKAAFRAAASAIAPKSRRDMLVLSISAHDPNRTLRRRKPGPTLGPPKRALGGRWVAEDVAPTDGQNPSSKGRTPRLKVRTALRGRAILSR